MTLMQELYEKVSEDAGLQEKFSSIMKDTEKDGEDVAVRKLEEFAKNAGFEVTFAEMKDFFKDLSEKSGGQLLDEELDMVAGGKSVNGILEIVTNSILGLGFTCAITSAVGEIEKSGGCADLFK